MDTSSSNMATLTLTNRPCCFSFSSMKTITLPITTSFPTYPLHLQPRIILGLNLRTKLRLTPVSATMASGSRVEVLPPAFTSASNPPQIFDGTTRLYISYTCPYAQRVWITRNCKGLQDKIKLVPMDLQDRPTWYKEKVYPANKVPALEHDNKVIGESLDLIKYIDRNFEGPSLYPEDSEKQEFAEELLSYTDNLHKAVASFLKGEANEVDAAFDYLEMALWKFDDGPFLLGQFSLVDIAYAPFFERYYPSLLELKQYDLTIGRPKLANWIEEMNKNEAYTQTQRDPKQYVQSYKKRYVDKL